jgi:hypothetical protein
MAAICPDVFCEPKARAVVKRRLREVPGHPLVYLKAAEQAVPCEPNRIPLERLSELNPFDLPALRSPVGRHQLILDHVEEPLEPIYFNLLDELMARDGWTVTKLVDTVSATQGSGLSQDLGRRTLMQQQEAAKLLTRVQDRVPVLLRLWQQWREQKRRLAVYREAQGADSPAREAALRRLRHRWQDETVAVHAESDPETDKHFTSWMTHSEVEQRQRLALDRQLLASELNLLKLQVQWLRPYLRPQQSSHATGSPELVTAFNTAVFEVGLLVEVASDLERAVQAGELPKLLLHRRARRCRPVLIIELRFRAVPQRAAPGSPAYRGRAELTFTSYALNDDELAVFRRELQRGEWGEVLGVLERDTAQHLDTLLADLDELLAEEQPEPVLPSSEDANPFTALFSIIEWFKPAAPETDRSVLQEPLRPDSEIERVLRSWALLEARQACLELYEHEKRTAAAQAHCAMA